MQHKKRRLLKQKNLLQYRGRIYHNNEKSKMKHLKNCSAISEKRLLQQPKKGTIAAFDIICCNIENESLQNNDEI
jgi:hypothetical protein